MLGVFKVSKVFSSRTPHPPGLSLSLVNVKKTGWLIGPQPWLFWASILSGTILEVHHLYYLVMCPFPVYLFIMESNSCSHTIFLHLYDLEFSFSIVMQSGATWSYPAISLRFLRNPPEDSSKNTPKCCIWPNLHSCLWMSLSFWVSFSQSLFYV